MRVVHVLGVNNLRALMPPQDMTEHPGELEMWQLQGHQLVRACMLCDALPEAMPRKAFYYARCAALHGDLLRAVFSGPVMSVQPWLCRRVCLEGRDARVPAVPGDRAAHQGPDPARAPAHHWAQQRRLCPAASAPVLAPCCSSQ